MYFYNESLIFSLHSLHKYNKLYLRTNKKVSIMQAMFKSELAKLAGVSSRTFRRYLATRRAILTAMGVSPFARKLPPQAVHYIRRQERHRSEASVLLARRQDANRRGAIHVCKV